MKKMLTVIALCVFPLIAMQPARRAKTEIGLKKPLFVAEVPLEKSKKDSSVRLVDYQVIENNRGEYVLRKKDLRTKEVTEEAYQKINFITYAANKNHKTAKN